jgi:FdhD protein
MKEIMIQNILVKKSRSGEWTEESDMVAVEEPLQIKLQYGPMINQVQKDISVTMRTPGQDKELAIGFLFTEGILGYPSSVKMIIPECTGPNTILVILKEDVEPLLANITRNFYTTSSCGVCGKVSVDAITTNSPFTFSGDQIMLPVDTFYGLHQQLEHSQSIFRSTGGLHASALFDLQGQFLCLFEDVGRHNALDKVIGDAFLKNNLPLSQNILLLSGRASFELVQKAAMAGIRIIASVGAPSSLAVELAQKHDITLVGFLRKTTLNVYSGQLRIK